MSTLQAETERALFTLFAKSTALPIVPGSIESRQPPEPDIRCVLSGTGPTCFELVEIIDSDLAKAVGIQLKFQNRLEADAATRKISGLSDALVFVSFSASSTNAQKQQACGALLPVIEQLPDGFRGDIDLHSHPDLTGVVRRLRITRGEFVGPAFQVDGGAFIADPIIARVQEKFAKKYTTDAPIELLAYYQMHRPTERNTSCLQFASTCSPISQALTSPGCGYSMSRIGACCTVLRGRLTLNGLTGVCSRRRPIMGRRG